MKTTFTILILTFNFFASKSYSQKTISLNANSNAGYSLNNYGKIEVISNLPDSNTLGFIPSDISNDRKFVKASKSVTPWLQSFVDKQFALNSNPNAKKLIWVIQDLSMGKDSTQKQAYSFVKLKADVYADNGQTNSNYQLVNAFDSTLVSSSEDVDLSQMISKVFLALYKNSVEINSAKNVRFQQMDKSVPLTKENIINKTKLSNSLPILKEESARGIYTSFAEFKNNSPAIKNFYADVNPQTKEVELYEIAEDSSAKLVQKAWGICINNELYFYADGQLYPIEKSGSTFYLAKYVEPRTRRNQAMYWRGYIGSKQGDNNPYNDAHVLRKTVSTAKNVSLEATHLDFDSADFTY